MIDVTEQDFQQQVIEKSQDDPRGRRLLGGVVRPVPHAGPGPREGRRRARRQGRPRQARHRRQPAPRPQFEIQSIPAVKAFKDGKVVEEFVGAQPPAKVAQFFDGLLPSQADALVEAGDEASLRRAIELEPARADAKVPLAIMQRKAGDLDGALETLANAEGDFSADGLAARIRLERAATRTRCRRSRRSTAATPSRRSTC